MTAVPLLPRTIKDVEYGRAGSEVLRMDVRIPDSTRPLPAAIIVHGGGWMRGDRVWNVEPLFAPLERAGFASFSISYRLAKDFLQIGVAVEDVRQAIHYIRANAATYGIDPNRVVLVGESAGAHLGALAALDEPGSVAAVVSLYGPTDLELLARTSQVVPEQIRQTIEGSAFAGLLVAHLRSLSPVERVKKGAPPFLLLHGTADHVVPLTQSIRMKERLLAAGGQADLITIAGGGHGMRFWREDWQSKLIGWLRHRLAANS